VPFVSNRNGKNNFRANGYGIDDAGVDALEIGFEGGRFSDELLVRRLLLLDSERDTYTIRGPHTNDDFEVCLFHCRENLSQGYILLSREFRVKLTCIGSRIDTDDITEGFNDCKVLDIISCFFLHCKPLLPFKQVPLSHPDSLISKRVRSKESLPQRQWKSPFVLRWQQRWRHKEQEKD
jgi:hypothetical protein